MNFRLMAGTAMAAALFVAPGMALAQQKGDKTSRAPVATPAPTAPAIDLTALEACSAPPGEGESLACSCPAGSDKGSVWGSGPFTGDSSICAAAVFSGVIGREGGPVLLEGLPGQKAYSGSSANGITTRDWGAYGQSFNVLPVAATQPASTAGTAPVLAEQCGKLPDGTDTLVCSCQGSPAEARESVWGSDPFTADSSICAAAILTGYIAPNEPGEVFVLRLQGLEAYKGTTSNGVTSRDWGSFSSSFAFDWNR